MQVNFFDMVDTQAAQVVPNDDWRPEAPPCLDGVTEIALNFETTGLRWWEHDRPGAIGLYAKGRAWYLPFRHAGGGNLDEATVKRWAQRELRGKHIVNINTRFDVNMSRAWGVHLEEQDNTVSDVAHYAALLNDHRFRTNLDTLIPEFLGEQPMPRLDESRLMSYSAGAAAPRAMYNVEAVHRLQQVMLPMLAAQDLLRVKQLEDQVIFPSCEMEWNGALLNQELLDQWITLSKDKYHDGIMQIYRATGLRINPNSSPDAAKLFRKLGIEITEFTEATEKHPKGQPSFPEEFLKGIKHPTVQLFRQTKKLGSVHSKLKKYRASIDSHGIMRYAMHQLRASKSDSGDSGESGTVVGRFTSTEIVDGFGVNIQQVLKPEKQFLSFGDEFFIRELFLPASGLYLSADAEQIQYRIAASRAKNPKILAKYAENPRMSFHKMVLALLREHKPDLPYKRGKDLNFAKMFVAGLTKIAFMLDEISKKEMLELRAQKAGRSHPKLRKTAEILNIYSREMPEMDALSKSATRLAETQGYVTSILGRRMRFPTTDRSYKAFNGMIIMSEADIVKTKLVELHSERKQTGFLLRAQVHDEVDGDIPDQASAHKVIEILERQSFPELAVPILWGLNTGTSWGDCSRAELAELREQRSKGLL